MAKIKVTLPIGDVVSMGKLVTFTAPCDCSVADTIVVNGWEFKMVNAVGYTIPEIGDEVFKEGAVVSVILDTEKNQAFLQNGNESYTKLQTLTATVAEQFGLKADNPPNDVFAFLGMYNLHWWRRRINTASAGWFEKRTLGTSTYRMFSAYSPTGGNEQSVQHTENISISQSNGGISYPNPTSTVIHYNNAQSVHNSYLRGSYIKSSSKSNNRWVYIPPTASIRRYTGRDDDYYVEYEAGQYYEVSSEYKTGGTIGEWEYLFSADSNAHPKSGIVSGYEYEYIGIPYKNFTSPPIQVAYGKYTGTGTWGESSPNKLTFSFAPKVVFMVQKAYVDSYGVNYHEPIYSGSTEGNAVMVADTLTESFQSGNGFYELGYINDEARYSYGKKSKDGKTFYWYFSYDKDRSSSQLNSKGDVYYWVAIG